MDDDGGHKVWTTQSYLIQKMNFQDSKILKKLTKIVFMGLWLPLFQKGLPRRSEILIRETPTDDAPIGRYNIKNV